MTGKAPDAQACSSEFEYWTTETYIEGEGKNQLQNVFLLLSFMHHTTHTQMHTNTNKTYM